MRVGGLATATAARAPGSARRPGPGTFTLSEGSASRAGSAAAGLRSIGGIDALIALQGLEDATERRKRAVRRGRVALDALDELKLGLLAGTLSPATLNRLRASAAFLKDSSGEDALDGVLREIELRVEVEIAKMTHG